MERTKNLISDTESLIIFAVIVSLTILIASVISRYIQGKLIKKTVDQGIDITSFLFFKHAIVATIILFGLGWAFLSLPISKNYAHSLFGGAGASTLILGFASQQILSNEMAGFF